MVFTNSEGKALDAFRPEWEKNVDRGSITLTVPDGATEIEFFSAFARNAPDEPLKLSARSSVFEPLALETKSDFLSGFLKALGRQSTDSMKLYPPRSPKQ